MNDSSYFELRVVVSYFIIFWTLKTIISDRDFKIKFRHSIVSSFCVRISKKIISNRYFKEMLCRSKGKYTWSDGSVYEGGWEEGKSSGKGKMIWPSGILYEGDFKEGLRHGNGKQTWPDGSVCEGNWDEDKMTGKGKFFWAPGTFYEGNLKDLRPHAFGICIMPGGKYYEGDWDEGKLRKGKVLYPSGQFYDGDFKSMFPHKCMVPHGNGKFTWTNGISYEGVWKEGKMTWEGKIFLPSGASYEIRCESRHLFVLSPLSVGEQ